MRKLFATLLITSAVFLHSLELSSQSSSGSSSQGSRLYQTIPDLRVPHGKDIIYNSIKIAVNDNGQIKPFTQFLQITVLKVFSDEYKTITDADWLKLITRWARSVGVDVSSAMQKATQSVNALLQQRLEFHRATEEEAERRYEEAQRKYEQRAQRRALKEAHQWAERQMVAQMGQLSIRTQGTSTAHNLGDECERQPSTPRINLNFLRRKQRMLERSSGCL